MTRFLLNAPVLTSYGEFRFEGPLSPVQAQSFMTHEGIVSAIGHQGAADWLSQCLGQPIPVNRQSIEMQPGDEALIVRMRQRLPEGAVLGSAEVDQVRPELALLTRLR